MLNDPAITIHGNLTDDPNLSFTPNGKAVVRFTVAHNSRVRDGDGNWSDGNPTFFKCELWGRPAENAAASFNKGNMVLAVGRIKTNKFPDRETGEERTYQYVVCDVVAASVMAAEVQIKTNRRAGATNGSESGSVSDEDRNGKSVKDNNESAS
jgi:single-strand DNA-binding protein